MRFRKPHFFHRSLHDLYSSIASRCLPAVQEVDAQEISGAESFVVQKAGETELRHPLEEAMYGPAFATSRVSWPEITGYQLPHVHVVGDQGCVYLPDGRRLDGPSAVWSPIKRKARRPIPLFARRESDPLFHLTGINHENHGHFLLDHLPRYFAARNCENIGEAKILLAPGHLKWQAKYLELLSVDRSRLIEGHPGTIRANQLQYVPQLNHNSKFCDPKIFRDMAAEMQSSIKQRGWYASSNQKREGPRAIWISRRDAPNRYLKNEDVLIEEARRILGSVEVMLLSRVPFKEQVRMIMNSEFVIGAQGQGIASSVFSYGRKVIILEQGMMPSEQRGWAATFRDMAELAGNQSVRFYSGFPHTVRDADWEFPKVKFAAELSRLKQLCERNPCLKS
jgi:capsular polysaccharide biosynthesis protein